MRIDDNGIDLGAAERRGQCVPTPSVGTNDAGSHISRGSCRRAGLWAACGVTLLFCFVALGQTMPPAPVNVGVVTERPVRTGQIFVGTVMPIRTSVVGSAVDGRVLGFPINEGDRVAKDQTLAQLLTNTLELELAAARAESDAATAELHELEAGTRKEEVDQAYARFQAADAILRNAQIKYDRVQRLFKGRSTSEADVEDATVKLDEAKHLLAERKAAHEMAVNGPRPEQIAQARAKVRMHEETCKRLEDQIEKHRIKSPFDGYVVAEFTEVGEWVTKGQKVAEVAELDQVDVEVFVLEDYIDAVAVGQDARVEISAVPGKVFTGKVVSLVPRADKRSRSCPVKVRVANNRVGGSVQLKAGMLARATLPTSKEERALLVPKDAIVLGGASPIVFVFEPSQENSQQGKVRPVPVELGVAHEGLIQVRGPLAAGQKVVVTGNERLRPAQDVLLSAAGK